MSSIVSWTGTFVNKDSTSMEAMSGDGVAALKMSRNSSVDFKLYWDGVYGVISSSSALAILYVTAGF